VSASGSAQPADDGSGPAGYDVKGNGDSMLYHTPKSPYYGRTRAAVWFDSESSAEAAGFTRWDQLDRNAGRDDRGIQARVFAAASVPDGAYGPGSAEPNPDGSGPAGYDIKGNADSMLYHTTDSAFYDVTKAEVWFATEDAARAAGFRNFRD
jgi:uncharacterized membrane protein ArfC